MFPLLKKPLQAGRAALMARHTVDLALEFATLGEYRLPVAPRPTAAVAGRPAVGAVSMRPRPSELRPATAAARRALRANQRERISSRSGMRTLAFGVHSQRPRQPVRKRAGAPAPRPQPCIATVSEGAKTMGRES